jgi:hypothetical protein
VSRDTSVRGSPDAWWEAELEAVAERLTGRTFDAEAEVARTSAASWRRATPGATFYSPMPFEARDRFEPGGRWSDDENEPADLVGLDQLGRPTVTIDAWNGRPRWLWQYGDDGCVAEEVDLRRHAVRRQLPPRDDVTAIAGAEPVRGGVRRKIQLLRTRDGQIKRVDVATRLDDEPAVASARTIRRVGESFIQIAVTAADLPDVTETGPSLSATLQRAGSLRPAVTVWDGRVDDPEPWPRHVDALVPKLAEAIAGAIRDALPSPTRAGWLAVRIPFLERRSLPPEVTLVDGAIVAAAERHGMVDTEVLEQVSWGHEFDPWIRTLPVVDQLDASALRTCRALSTATTTDAPEDDTARAEAALHQLADVLAELLADVEPTPLVFVSDHSNLPSLSATLERAQRTVGKQAVTQVLRLVAG